MKNTTPETICKWATGIDVSKDTIEAEFGTKTIGDDFVFSQSRSFSNSPSGFTNLIEWVSGHTEATDQVWFIIEATGVYYEELAWFLHHQGRKVCLLVATRANHYAESLPVKTKTDPVDARILTRYGLERAPRRWQPPSGKLRTIKALLRERAALKKEQTRLTNRLHAARTAYNHPESIIRRLEDHIAYIDRHVADIEAQLEALWTTDQNLADPLTRIAEINGLRPLTILTVIAETNGFACRPNRNQLVSYSGLDVVLDDSGQHSGPTSISKHGNAHIRRALYMPAVAASQHNRALRAFYGRLIEKFGDDQKQKAIVAVMRKLLLLIHSLWKSGQKYDPDFHYQQIIKAA
ncbi:MAG: IS110 family transposase [Candidatus Halalkalibacterium sp. M3_1C_030]